MSSTFLSVKKKKRRRGEKKTQLNGSRHANKTCRHEGKQRRLSGKDKGCGSFTLSSM